MYIAYAVGFFLFVAVCETLRHGIFGLTAVEISTITSGGLALMSVLFLRGDLLHLLRPPRKTLYGRRRLRWSWGRSAVGLILTAILWGGAVLAATAAGVLELRVFTAETLIELAALQMVVAALPQQLFFRETVVKACHQSLPAIYLVSTLACFVFFMPEGPRLALLAAAAGLYLLTLRLSGVNILAVAAAHAAANVMLAHVIVPVGAAAEEPWRLALAALALSVILSAILYRILAGRPEKDVFEYA